MVVNMNTLNWFIMSYSLYIELMHTIWKYIYLCYKVIHINDDKWVKIKNYFDECNKFIETAINNGGKVLIHCKFGASRSITIALAYMIYKNKITPGKLLEKVKQKREETNPNIGFIDQLNDYYNELYKNNIE